VGRPFEHEGDARARAGWELIARSVRDYQRGDSNAGVLLVSDAEGERFLPAAHFFRRLGEMPTVEREALRLARGRVLDVGAGAGAHAIALQENGHEVTAIEVSDLAVVVMKERGVLDARRLDIFAAPDEERWHTVLILMNGTTVVGSASRLVVLFQAASARLAVGGRILIDSTDLRDEDGAEEGEDGRYVGEVQLQVSYGEERSEPFGVLYAHPELLVACAEAAGLQARVLARGEDGAYLAEVF